jgi:hypothetical protein
VFRVCAAAGKQWLVACGFLIVGHYLEIYRPWKATAARKNILVMSWVDRVVVGVSWDREHLKG